MRADYLLSGPAAAALYEGIKDLPIIDYHCHLSPKEILEDRQFSNLGEMWLGGDHYKWRLMRQAGVPEEFITGNAPWREKFRKYAETVSLAGGNPLFSWSRMELSLYFGIDTPLNGETADGIFDAAQAFIEENQLSPRKLIQKAGVEYIATTDDPAEPLDFHRQLAADHSFATKVAPAFRPDTLFGASAPGFPDYVKKFGTRMGISIDDLGDLRIALRLCLDEFTELGCTFSDLGIEGFPDALHTREEAAPVFAKALRGLPLTSEELALYQGYLYSFLAGEYRKRGMTMQLHLAAKRDANTLLTASCGRDTGSDCVGDPIEGSRIIRILDALNSRGKLPKTVIYTLNPVMNAQLAAICGTFPGVVPGAAWWYCDHRRGIEDMMETMAEEGYFGSFLGMLTDSRSFLSYARHDYFRRILANLLAKWVETEDFPMESARELAYRISYGNSKERTLTGEAPVIIL